MSAVPSSPGVAVIAYNNDEASRWTSLQAFAVGTCFVLNMLDGMDILMMSYLAPAITSDWNIGAAALGVVFSAALAGMMVGALVLAPLADQFGRRPVILWSVALMGLSMISCGFAPDITTLIVLRFIVGLGIGAILASMAAITSEYSPARYRIVSVALLQAGYPIGAMLAGLAVNAWLPDLGWRVLMSAAGGATLILLPFAVMLLPESLEFLEKRQPRGALACINAIRRRMGQPPMLTLTEVGERKPVSFRLLFDYGQWRQTLLLWAAFFCCYMTLYFAIAWIPRLAIEAGLDRSQAIVAGTVYNFGAFSGGLALCWLLFKFDVRRLVLLMMLGGSLSLVAFAVPMSVTLTLLVAFCIGFTVQGGFNGLYPLVAGAYPAQVRSTGIGWCIGVGRSGAVIGPLIAGWLLAAQQPLSVLFLIFTVPLISVGLLVMAVTLRAPEPPKP
ncbi:MFS transporter [Methylorubrum sp. SL192]|uniref:MFS transporter n=1 Tax=Methylorubrum sp. SL192 TaxID=2995167 RepID=UPI0022764799|nr:MFS transporter [Methylorubrum sp. SL192]MCY1643175.1 MFS transporter [Methylorubrum sp. SL192]